MEFNRALLPIFMALSTLLGILPFVGLLNLDIDSPNLIAILLSLSGGCIANLPSVNVRPCLLNVNPPETRGAAMTASNLMINVARGAGPSLIIFSQALFGVSRRYSFNVSIIVFWVISAFLLIILAFTFPADQDAMDKELAEYAHSIMNPDGNKRGSFRILNKNTSKHDVNNNNNDNSDDNDDEDEDQFSMNDSIRSMSFDEILENATATEEESLMSIEDRMHSFDAAGANESLKFIGDAMREIGQEFIQLSRGSSSRRNYQMISTNDGSQEVIWDGTNEEGAGNYLAGTGLLNNDTAIPSRRGPDIDLDRGTKDNAQSGFRTKL